MEAAELQTASRATSWERSRLQLTLYSHRWATTVGQLRQWRSCRAVRRSTPAATTWLLVSLISAEAALTESSMGPLTSARSSHGALRLRHPEALRRTRRLRRCYHRRYSYPMTSHPV